ncbi:MAG: hypothetical protein V4813_04590 [Gemmatimonadota bacterium]
MTRCARAGRDRRGVAARLPLLLLAILTGCSDGPAAPVKSEPTIRLCNIGTWLAYRNEGAEWVAADVRGGAAEFAHTERVTLAFTDTVALRSYVVVEFLTATQAEARHPCATTTFLGPTLGTFSGTLRGVVPGDRASVLYGGATSIPSNTADSTALSYTLPVMSGLNDLFAVRRSRADTTRIDRVIVRRTPNPSAGQVVNLDFGSSEAVAPASFMVSWNDRYATLREAYRSGEMSFPLYASLSPLPAGAHQLLALPGPLRAPDDRYEISLTSSFGPEQSVTAYVRNPADLALSFGPDPLPPVITEVAATATRQLRFDVPSQAQYGGSVELTVYQSAPMPSTLVLLMTREFAGVAASTWSLAIPDLSRLPGAPVGIGIRPGGWSWQLEVASGELPHWSVVPPDGLIVRSAKAWGYSPE